MHKRWVQYESQSGNEHTGEYLDCFDSSRFMLPGGTAADISRVFKETFGMEFPIFVDEVGPSRKPVVARSRCDYGTWGPKGQHPFWQGSSRVAQSCSFTLQLPQQTARVINCWSIVGIWHLQCRMMQLFQADGRCNLSSQQKVLPCLPIQLDMDDIGREFQPLQFHYAHQCVLQGGLPSARNSGSTWTASYRGQPKNFLWPPRSSHAC